MPAIAASACPVARATNARVGADQMALRVGERRHDPGIADPVAGLAAEQPLRLAHQIDVARARECPDQPRIAEPGARDIDLEREIVRAQRAQARRSVAARVRPGKPQPPEIVVGHRQRRGRGRRAEPFAIGHVRAQQFAVGIGDRDRAARAVERGAQQAVIGRRLRRREHRRGGACAAAAGAPTAIVPARKAPAKIRSPSSHSRIAADAIAASRIAAIAQPLPRGAL